MWSIMENVPCELNKVYSAAFRWNVLKYLLSPSGLVYHSGSVFPYWFFCLDDLSLDVSGVLKSPTIIMLLSISPFMTVSICLIYWGALILGAYTHTRNSNIFLDWSLDHYVVSFFVSCHLLYFKAYFIWYKYCFSSFLLIFICLEYLFSPFHF